MSNRAFEMAGVRVGWRLREFMVILDVTGDQLVALLVIRFGRTSAMLRSGWAMTWYALAFGGFLLFAGACGRPVGRRRMLLAGLVAFTACRFSSASARIRRCWSCCGARRACPPP